VFEGDSSVDVAERLLSHADPELISEAAELIEEKINVYLLEVSRSIGKDIIGRCLIELDNQETENLFVSKGDSPRNLAKNFCENHDLGATWENRIE
jgi:uncharacterized protein (DUF1778 family)